MSTEPPAKKVTYSIDYDQIKRFLSRLAEDPKFRAQLGAGGDDTRAALAEYNIEISPEALPDEISLPDEQATRDLLAKIEEKYDPQPEAAAYVLGFKVLIHVLSPPPTPPPPPQSY
jgi:hypothetical protein